MMFVIRLSLIINNFTLLIASYLTGFNGVDPLIADNEVNNYSTATVNSNNNTTGVRSVSDEHTQANERDSMISLDDDNYASNNNNNTHNSANKNRDSKRFNIRKSIAAKFVKNNNSNNGSNSNSSTNNNNNSTAVNKLSKARQADSDDEDSQQQVSFAFID